MRIDGWALSESDRCRWRVWHARECRFVTNCLWADEETARWGSWRMVDSCYLNETHQAERIVIYPERKFIVIDPVDDIDMAEADRTGQDDDCDLKKENCNADPA